MGGATDDGFMPIVISREEGLFSVLLEKQQWLEPSEFAPLFSSALSLPRTDGMRACRLQRGILFQGVSQDAADSLSKNMADLGAKVEVVADADVPQLPRPIDVALCTIGAEGLVTPSIRGAGMPDVWLWKNLRMMTAGITLDPAQQAAGFVDSIDHELIAEAEDRVSLAKGQLEKAATRVFPLKEELARSDANVADALRAVLAKDATPEDPEHGFGHVTIALDMFFTDPLDRLRIHTETRIQNHVRLPSPIKNLHAALADIADYVDQSVLTASSKTLIASEDSRDYLFEDLRQFEEYQRWAFYQQLQKG
ncbi:MAG: hypothetical protein ACYTDT_08240 [Planctomycetota bacterium]|jgi:hypothetical protein